MSEERNTGRSRAATGRDKAATGRNAAATGIGAAFTGRNKAYTGSHEAVPEPKAKAKKSPKIKEKMRPKSKRALYICGTVLAAILIIVMAVVLKSAAADKSYSVYFDRGSELYESQDYDGALAYLRKAASKDKTVECVLLMSRCYERLGNIDKALELLRGMDTQDAQISARINELEALRRAQQEAELVEIAGEKYQLDSSGLVADNAGLRDADLDNVVRLRALSSLSIADNSITDISPLTALGGLTTLNLSGNRISDISPLAGLLGLRTLYLDSNPITDFTPLYGLDNLILLSIKGISMTPEQLAELTQELPGCTIYSEGEPGSAMDISIGGVTFSSDITELDLSGKDLNDISALSACKNLVKLNISDNNISDLSPLMDQKSLRELDISGNLISDLRPLMALTSLEVIHAGNNLIRSTVPLGGLSALKELCLDSNKLTDVSGIKKLTSLETLCLRDSGMTDESMIDLGSIPSLLSLNIENNPNVSGETVDAFKSLNPACEVTHSTLVYLVELGGKQFREDITELDASNLDLVSISAMGEFDALERVNLSGNRISNIYIFQWLSGIKEINLEGNQVSDVSPLLSMESLEVLDLTDNCVSSTSALCQMTWLKELHIAGNDLTAEQIDELRQSLPNTTIYAD